MSLPDDVAPPRLRMFAGPNGSGKSTIKSIIADINEEWLSVFINPDEIEAGIKETGFLNLHKFDVTTKSEDVIAFFQNYPLIIQANLSDAAARLGFNNNQLDFTRSGINSYFASTASDFIRQKLIENGKSFSFESVMSHPSKLKILEQARLNGYRNYLYYVAIDDPMINISRVEERVKRGGHDVPKEKIEARYYRSLELLLDAVKLTNRTYIFDNSGEESTLIAEITEGEEIEIMQEDLPDWFEKYILNKNS